MTNTKFRKRALLSAVAMLLVALVALGSATFAWFTENPVVKASGITGQAQTSTGLEIKTTTDATPSSEAHFMADGAADSFKFIPAYAFNTGTTTKSLNFFTTQATSAANGAPKENATWSDAVSIYTPNDGTAIASGDSGVYHEQCFIKTKNGTSAVNVNLTGISIEGKGGLDIKDGVTVLVAVDNEIKAVKKLGNTAITDYGTPNNGDTVTASGEDYPNMFITPVGLGQADDGTAANKWLVVDVYVYLDGTDPAVKTNNAIAGALLNNITLEFAKAS